MSRQHHVLVTGGAGYVGSALVPRLLAAGYKVTVLDLYLYLPDLFASLRGPNLTEIRGDLRDPRAVETALAGCDSVIHLACISNDPSYDLDPDLGRSINHDAFLPLVRAAKKAGVRRFIYASSSSVYGVKDEGEVTEDLVREPLTDYSKYKALCEDELLAERVPGFHVGIIRPATVCGYAPRLRLDLTVNILTNHALNKGKITVFGGDQKRPNIHIDDMADLYLHLMEIAPERWDGRIFNAGWENFTVLEIARMVRDALGTPVDIEVVPTNDNRSYHVSSERMKRELGFIPRRTIADAVRDLADAFAAGKVPDPFDNPVYFNIKLMQQTKLA